MIRRFAEWLDHQTGIRGLLHAALDEPIPGGASLAYVFGSGLLFLFISQVVTGVFLALYYVPSADHAHTTSPTSSRSVVRARSSEASMCTVRAPSSSCRVGAWRSTIRSGSYKGPRHRLWLSVRGGCSCDAGDGVLHRVPAAVDQKGVFRNGGRARTSSCCPSSAPGIKASVRGGNELGTLTISRFFVAHASRRRRRSLAFVSMTCTCFAGLERRARRAQRRTAIELFYPRQLVMDIAFAADAGPRARRVSRVLGACRTRARSKRRRHPLSPTPGVVRRSDFPMAKYWPAERAVVGIFVIPTIVAVSLPRSRFLIAVPSGGRGDGHGASAHMWH